MSRSDYCRLLLLQHLRRSYSGKIDALRVIEPPHALQVFAVGTGATNLIYSFTVPSRFTLSWPS